MTLENGQVYGSGSDSTIGTQLQTHYYQKKALQDLQKEKYFSQLADVTNMPKNFGKTIKRYHYVPMLDDRNINDQGIDAAGAILDSTKWYVFSGGSLVPDATITGNSSGFATEALAIAEITDADTQVVTQGYGNLYGSSKDIGTVQGKLPALSETGGRVNRVGFTRVNLEGAIEKFGFFEEYTEESLNFDTDAELATHINREMLFGAHEITEDMLQIDIIENAGVTYFTGAAEDLDEISGESGAVTEVTYPDLVKLDIELTNNRCPKQTKIITGTRMVDTKVIPACRIMYIGSEMQPTIMQMKDYHTNPAFIPLAQYAAAGSEINGEIGSVGSFRIIVVPEMLHHAGVGASVTTNAGYRTTNGKYDAYPLLVVGSESYTTIGFQTSGKMTKFRIFHKKPGKETADRTDPFGETGFMSIKWYYGFLALRTERIAVIWSAAQM